jgi:hypothetical protein
MKVGIITFHAALNYGAVLQCYALQQAIGEMGYEVGVIDYTPWELDPVPPWRGWGLRGEHPLQAIRKRWLTLKHGGGARAVFSDFRKQYLRCSPNCRTDEEVAHVVREYDAIVTGSDQVWVFDRSPHYFLKLDPSYRGGRLSYAACCGHDRQTMSRTDNIQAWLSKMDAISVRNDFSRQLIAPLVDKPVEVVADPTLLQSFDTVQRAPAMPEGPYILVYSLSGNRGRILDETVSAARCRWPIPVVVAMAGTSPWVGLTGDRILYNVTPEEWVWLISHASFVCTDSYHGMLFSIKYERPFVALYSEPWRALRLLDTAKRLGVESLLAHNADEAKRIVVEMDEFDWNPVNNRLNAHVDYSNNYLMRMLASFARVKPIVSQR